MLARSLYLLLAAQLLLSSCGVVINRHYCMGELKTSALFGKAKSCWDYLDAEPPAPVNGQYGLPNCCDDTTQLQQESVDAPGELAAEVSSQSATLAAPLATPSIARPAVVATERPGRAPPLLRDRLLPPWRQLYLL